MLELLGAFALTVAILAGAVLRGRQRKQSNFERVLGAPEQVSRLFLRHAGEVDAYWLYARLASGKKLCLVPPWEVDDALRRLAPSGLTLSAEDAERLAECARKSSWHAPQSAPRAGKPRVAAA
jgi:hypothetical protein